MAAAKSTAKPVAVATPATASAAEAPVAEAKVEKAVAAKKETVKKETAKKAPAKKETAKKETVKKETAKKAPAKKETAKKTTAKKALKSEVQLQFAGKSYTQDDLVKIAQDVWKYDLGQKASELTSVELYVKPEEQTVYYVMNKEFTGNFAI